MLDNMELDKVFIQTIAAIEKGREQIFDIAEVGRQEQQRVSKELKQVKKETTDTIDKVNELVQMEKAARRRLMDVSKNFNQYTEADIQHAYEHARTLQIELGHMQERETQLRLRRDQLDVSLRQLNNMVEKADNMASQVSIAQRILTTSLQGLSERLEELYQRQYLGIRVIMAQEEERKRVAREIHDGPAQSMANIVLRGEICEKMLEIDVEGAKLELAVLKSMVKDSLQDVRKIIYDLRPMALDDLGIIPTLRRYLTEFTNKHKLPVNFSVTGERRFASVLEVALFRIIQEALNNTYKHAQASMIDVKMEIMPELVNLMVVDNGRGFSLDKDLFNNTNKDDVYGLMGMRERVELLDGTMKIKTAPGEGTKIVVQIPIKV